MGGQYLRGTFYIVGLSLHLTSSKFYTSIDFFHFSFFFFLFLPFSCSAQPKLQHCGISWVQLYSVYSGICTIYHTECVSQLIYFGHGWTILLYFLILQDLQSNFLRATTVWHDTKKYQEALTRDEVCKASQGTIDKKIDVSVCLRQNLVHDIAA